MSYSTRAAAEHVDMEAPKQQDKAQTIINHWLQRYEEATGETKLAVVIEPISYNGSIAREIFLCQQYAPHVRAGLGSKGSWTQVHTTLIPTVIAQASDDIEAYISSVEQTDDIIDGLYDEIAGVPDGLFHP